MAASPFGNMTSVSVRILLAFLLSFVLKLWKWFNFQFHPFSFFPQLSNVFLLSLNLLYSFLSKRRHSALSHHTNSKLTNALNNSIYICLNKSCNSVSTKLCNSTFILVFFLLSLSIFSFVFPLFYNLITRVIGLETYLYVHR